VIVCPRCGKENQDHYKFCLGCGAELPAPELIGVAPTQAPADAHKAIAEMALGASVDAASTPAEQPAPGNDSGAPESSSPPAGHASDIICPNCGATNPAGFQFCGSCGSRLAAAPEQATDAPSPAQPDSVQPEAAPRMMAQLALIRPDGSADGTHDLQAPEAIVGRGCGPLFDHDTYLSPHHARFYLEEQQLMMEDIGSLNGVFVRIEGDQPLRDGDVFRIGQELLRFNLVGPPRLTEDGVQVLGSPNPGYWGRLSLVVGQALDASAFPLMGDEMVLGRERGDILFSDDGYVSATHARIAFQGDYSAVLQDMGSSNGTFVRIREPVALQSGSYILMGQQLFRVEL
jgi:pSer/pThr/pTyr-binding forkhead associated (FHA) protein